MSKFFAPSFTITYNNKLSRKGTNGRLFRFGDQITVSGMDLVPFINGVYKLTDPKDATIYPPDVFTLECLSPGSDRCFGGWNPNTSYNIPIFKGRTIVSSGGAVLSSSITAGNSDVWVHFSGGILPARTVSPAVAPTPTPTPPPPVASYPVTVISEPPSGNGNNLVSSGFDIDKFIASANFKPGLNAAANAKGAAAFRADAKRAAKAAKLTPGQTQKLMDAVNKAIAEGIAKAKNKPLPKPIPRR